MCAEDPIVTSTADDGPGSLREAIAQVCSGDTITFDIAGAGPHTITLTTGELVVAKDVTIKNNSGESITVSGGGVSRVFNINPATLAAIIGLTISGGSATSGGGILNDGTLTVISTLTGNAATTGDGGAISNPGTLTVINSTLSGNSAGGSGGGIFTSNVLNLLSTVTNNRADSDNNSTGTGGGVHRSAGTATLHNSIVAGNFNEDGASDGNDDIAGNLDGASSSNLIGDAATSGTLTNGTNGNIVGNGGTGTINIATVIDTTLANNGGTTQTHRLISDESGS